MTFDVCNMIGKANGHLLDINCGIADNVIANSTKMGMSAKESAYTPSWDTPNKSPLKEMILKYYQEVNPKAYVEKAKGALECAYFVIKNTHPL